MNRLRQLIREKRPDLNWEKFDQHGEMVLEMFRQPVPKYLVRMGDGEQHILQNQHPAWIAQQLAVSIRHADGLGLPGVGPGSIRTQTIADALRNHYQTGIDHAVHVSAYLFMYAPELVGRLATGKRVLWITSEANVIVNNLNDPAFRDFYGLHGIVSNDWINAAPGREDHPLPASVSAQQAYTDIQEQLTRAANFDLALVGAGVTGKPVCHHIKTTLGKSAIDIGIVMSLLRGLRERTQFKRGGQMDFLVWDPAR